MKVKFIFLMLITIFILTTGMEAQPTSAQKKILVVYYSWGGNTQEMANQIGDAAKADIFQIVPAIPYPADYKECAEQAKKEISSNHKPALKSKPNSIDSYDVIFVGSPNWWSTIAPPAATFLSSYDFSGKTIVPFITHEGTRMGSSVADIKKLCPKSTILDGLPIRGGSVKKSKEQVEKWLREIEIIK
ncbi:MAG: flavodoxin [Prevotellaceae bacterium]|jgi:flavodoxin|nr:flavodoxin [Prevotellaceae bacterium]